MDFADAPEHAAFRLEFRDWLEANLTDDLKVEDAQDQRISRPEGSILKLFGSELAGRIADFSGTLLGPYATLDTPTEAVPDASRWLHRVLGARQYTIAGGTSEIQRNIIGERVLGLPRG